MSTDNRQSVRAWVAEIGGRSYAISPSDASMLMEIAGRSEVVSYGLHADGSYGQVILASEQNDTQQSYFLTKVEFMQIELVDDVTPEEPPEEAAAQVKPHTAVQLVPGRDYSPF